MKIKKIECPACGYSFRVKKSDINSVIECPSCKASVYLDDEKPSVVNININNYGTNSYKAMQNTSPNKGAGVAGIFVFLALIMLGYVLTNFMHNDTESITYSHRTVPESEAFVEFVESLYGKAVESISEEDYNKIAYLYVKRDYPEHDGINADEYPWRFDYAFSVDDNGEPIDVKSIIVSREADLQQRDIQVFSNLVSVGFGGRGYFSWDEDSYGDINYKNLKKLKYYKGDSFSSLADAFDDPSKIEKLSVTRFEIEEDSSIDVLQFSGLKTLEIDYVGERGDLDKVSDFKNLEELTIKYIDNNTLDFLTSLTKLRSLELNFADGSFSDINVFYGLPNIEELSLIDMCQLKSIDFVKNMPKLNNLTLYNCSIISVEPLRDNIVLTELNLSNLAVTDLSVLPTLKSLQTLTVHDVNVEIDAFPNLGDLSLLKKLSLDSRYLNSIHNMTNLECLELEEYYYSTIDTMATLTGLKSLKIDLCDKDLSGIQQIAALPNLEDLVLHLDSYEWYYIDPIFSSSSIKSLNLICSSSHSGIRYLCIDFNKITDNNVLKNLYLNSVYIVDINDGEKEKRLGECSSDFLAHFKALEELYVRDNMIGSLDFVSAMPNLKMLDIADNYISDLTPLLSCKHLEKLRCERNDIRNLNILPDTITVLPERK